MKNYYIFLLSLLFYCESNAQTKCSEADSDINYAYSHIKSAYDANNISDLKYFSNRSLEAFERAKPILKACGCEKVYTISFNSIEMLKKVDIAETYEDGRFFVKRTRELARKGIAELDNCNQITIEEEELLTLEMEQSNLRDKQLELERKQEEIKIIMAEQKAKEIMVQKEILIGKYETAIASNINSYNEALQNCDCNARIENVLDLSEKPFSKSDSEIKLYYVDAIKKLSSLYVLKLETCLMQSDITTVDD